MWSYKKLDEKHFLENLHSIPCYIGSLQCYFLWWSNAIKNWHGTLKCHSRYCVTVREGNFFAFAPFL